MGSEFSNANMTAPGLEDFTYSFLGEDSYLGRKCYMIVSVPKNTGLEDEYGYSKSVSWVDEETYLVHRINYFDFDGEMFKSIVNSDFKELETEKGKFMVTAMKAVNHENNRSSEMVMDQVELSSANESYFTVAYLEKE